MINLARLIQLSHKLGEKYPSKMKHKICMKKKRGERKKKIRLPDNRHLAAVPPLHNQIARYIPVIVDQSSINHQNVVSSIITINSHTTADNQSTTVEQLLPEDCYSGVFTVKNVYQMRIECFNHHQALVNY